MTDEEKKAILDLFNIAMEGVRAGHKFELSVLQNEIAKLKKQIGRLTDYSITSEPAQSSER